MDQSCQDSNCGIPYCPKCGFVRKLELDRINSFIDNKSQEKTMDQSSTNVHANEYNISNIYSEKDTRLEKSENSSENSTVGYEKILENIENRTRTFSLNEPKVNLVSNRKINRPSSLPHSNSGLSPVCIRRLNVQRYNEIISKHK